MPPKPLPHRLAGLLFRVASLEEAIAAAATLEREAAQFLAVLREVDGDETALLNEGRMQSLGATMGAMRRAANTIADWNREFTRIALVLVDKGRDPR
jgi:hypothetical protein